MKSTWSLLKDRLNEENYLISHIQLLLQTFSMDFTEIWLEVSNQESSSLDLHLSSGTRIHNGTTVSFRGITPSALFCMWYEKYGTLNRQ